MSQRRPRLLLLAMYPLDRGLWGATTRITQLRDALARICDLEVISGTRWPRARRLARVARSLGRYDGIYVENATTLPGPADLAFLALARARRVPILTYVRDAQQLFAEYDSATMLKQRISRRAFLPALRMLMGVSTHVAFPSRGLARAIHGDDRDVLLLPPGARVAPEIPLDPMARALLFVGPLNRPAHGADLLRDAMELVRAEIQVDLIAISRPGEELPGPTPVWLRRERAEGPEIDRFLPEVMATITPRRRTAYNDLAVPIKVLEYLGYGRPLIVTDTHETAVIVRDAGSGVIVPDTVGKGMADGIRAVATAPLVQRIAWGAAARRAAERNSWDVRARQIIGILQPSGNE